MNSLPFRRSGPAQRAAGEITNTLHGVAADVRELTGTLEALRSRSGFQPEAAPPSGTPTAETIFPAESESSPPPATENQREQPGAPASTASPPQGQVVEVQADIAGTNSPPAGPGVPASPVEPRPPAKFKSDHPSDAARAPGSPERTLPSAARSHPATSPTVNGATPPTLPTVPDVSGQLEVFMAATIRNQESILRAFQKLTAYCERLQPQTDAYAQRIDRLTLRMGRDIR